MVGQQPPSGYETFQQVGYKLRVKLSCRGHRLRSVKPSMSVEGAVDGKAFESYIETPLRLLSAAVERKTLNS